MIFFFFFFTIRLSESPPALLFLFNCTFFSVSYALRAGPRALVFINIMGMIWDSIFGLEGTIICYHGNPNSGEDVGLGLCEPRKRWTKVVSRRDNYF